MDSLKENLQSEQGKVKKKPNKFLNLLISIGCMVAFFMTLNMVIVVCMIPITAKAYLDAHSDIALVSQLIQEYSMKYSLYCQFVGEVVLTVLSILLYNLIFVRKNKKNGTYESGIKKSTAWITIATILVGEPVIFCMAVILETVAVKLMPGVAEMMNEMLSLAAGAEDNTILGKIIGYLSIGVLAPIAEEVTFRGIIVENSKRAYKIVGCVIITAVLFGIMHMNPIQALYVLPMGAISGFIAYKYKTVIPSICIHIINNSIGLYIGYLFDPFEYWWVMAIISVVAIPCLLLIFKKNPYITQSKTK